MLHHRWLDREHSLLLIYLITNVDFYYTTKDLFEAVSARRIRMTRDMFMAKMAYAFLEMKPNNQQ